jgi:hypothetical protein
MSDKEMGIFNLTIFTLVLSNQEWRIGKILWWRTIKSCGIQILSIEFKPTPRLGLPLLV